MKADAFHEDLRGNTPPTIGSARSFGLSFSSLFLIIALLPLLKHAPPRYWALAIAAVFLLLACATPRWLEPLNRLWQLVGVVLNRVMTPLWMALVFAFAITPIALIRRALGDSGLALRFDPAADSYWIAREQTATDVASLKRQY